MATLADFRLRISAKLGLDNTVSGDQPLIDSWINEAVSEVLTRSRSNVVPGTMALTSGQFDYTLPTGILALEEVYLAPVNTTQAYLMTRKSPGDIIKMRISGSGGTPPTTFYALNGANTLMVYPTPLLADVITFYYVPRPATLSAGTDTPSDISTEWHKVIEYYGLWQGAQYMNDSASQQGMVFQKLYEEELNRLQRGALQRGGRKLSRAVVGRMAPYNRMIGSPSQQGV